MSTSKISVLLAITMIAGCAYDAATGRYYVEPEVAGAGLGAAVGAIAGNPGLGAAVGAGAGHLTRYSRYGQNWQPATRLEYQYQTPPVPTEETCTSAYVASEQQINSAVTNRQGQAASYRAITRDEAGVRQIEQGTTSWQASSLQSARGQYQSCIAQIGVVQPQQRYSQPQYSAPTTNICGYGSELHQYSNGTYCRPIQPEYYNGYDSGYYPRRSHHRQYRQPCFFGC